MFIFYHPINFYIILNLILWPRKHTTDTDYIVKIIQTAFYQQHKYFNLVIFN